MGEQSASKLRYIYRENIMRHEAYKENSRTFDSLFPVSAFRALGWKFLPGDSAADC